MPLSSTTPGSSAKMMDEQYKYIVLGGGVSAGYIAKAFVDKGIARNTLAIISKDKVPPYERPALSKGFLSAEDPSRLPGFYTSVATGGKAQEKDWYKHNGVVWLGGKEVVDIDFDQQVLKTKTDDKFTYEKLIIATGMEANKLPREQVGENQEGEIYYLRVLEDAEHIVEMMQSRRGQHVLMLGGGYIGTEVTARLLDNGLKVTMVFPEDFMLKSLLPQKMGELYERTFKDHGVNIIKSKLKTLKHDDNNRLVGAILENGQEIGCDVVVAGIGASPNMTLFKDRLTIMGDGIKVDEFLHTSEPNVYAVGDMASFPLLMEKGKHVRIEHVQNARDSGRRVVEVITAEEEGREPPKYDYLPYFYTRCMGLNWKLYGVNDGDLIYFGNFKEGEKYGAFWIRDSQIVGTLLDNASQEEHDEFKKIAATRPTVKSDDDIQRLITKTLGEGFQTFK
eukprot:m.73220 g.73220  ORF g.73220 m.73220 type:complete len:450 (-) comp13882_c1_seq1:330-1679(-)